MELSGRHHNIASPESGELPLNAHEQLSQQQTLSSQPRSLLSQRGNFSSFRSNTLSKFGRSHEADDDPQETKGRLGLNTLYDPPHASASVDIIFIHGIGGGSRKTWAAGGDDDNFWPALWLPSDPDFEDARIHSFGYLAEWGKRSTTTLSIHDFAQSLVGEMRNNPSIRKSDTRIIFVGHSMGGVLAKKAYIIARQDPGLKELAARVQSMFFLATPHRGSDLARILRSMLQVTWNSKPFINDLVSNSAALVEINDTFRHYASDLRLWSFFETQPASNRLNVLVVDKFSATLGYNNEEISAMDADHRYVCKFKSQLDPNYRKIRNALSSAMDNVRPSPKTAQPIDIESKVKAYLGMSETPEDDLAMLLDMKSPDSCNWLTETSSFSEWRDHESGGQTPVYWLTGPPAAGKSVISSHVVDHLRERGTHCSYYFFKQGKAGSRSLASLLLCLAYQMAVQDPAVAQRVAKLDDDLVSFDPQDEHSVWRKVMSGIFQSGSMGDHTWIIDGLDECHKFGNLFRFMGYFPPGLGAFVTSRTTPEIERGIISFGSSVRLHRLSVNDTLMDIQKFIEVKLFELSLGGSENLTGRILDKASGSFLWVRLVLQELEKAYTDEDIEAILNDVPGDLGDFYHKILNTIELEKRRARLAKSMLTWIALAIRPLSVDELRCAVHLDINETPMEQVITATCGQLTFIDRSGRVQMIHETAREFLFSEGLKSELAISRGRGHGHLAKLCLMYLGNSLRPQIGSRLLKGRSSLHPDIILLDYAAESFSQHLYRSQSEEPEPFDALCAFLDTSVLLWIEHAAKSQNLGLVTQTAIYFSAYLERRTKYVPSIDKAIQQLEAWVLDLSRVPTKFRKALLESPSSIHTIIPALCPTNSAIAQKAREYIPSVSVAGLRDAAWDDCLMRIDYSEGLTTTIGQGHRYFAVGRSTGNVDIYDSATLQHISLLRHEERVRFLDFGTECEYLVTAGQKHLAIWDPKSGTKLDEFPSQGPLAIYFSWPLLMVASKDREIIIRDLDCGDVEVQKLPEISPDLPKQAPSRVAFSELGLVALAYRNYPVFVIDIENRALLGSCSINNNNGIDSMAFNPNPDIFALVVSFVHGNLVVFDTRTMEAVYNRPNVFAQCIACSSDGRFLLTGSSNGLIEVYEFEGLERAIPTLIYRITSLREAIRAVSFSTNGLRFVNISTNTCRVWEPSVLVRRFPETVSQSDFSGGVSIPPRSSRSVEGPEKAEITSMASIQGHTVVCGKSNGEVALLSAATGHELTILCRHSSGVSRIEYVSVQDGFLLATMSSSGQVMLGKLNGFTQSSDYSTLLDKRLDHILLGVVIAPSGDQLLVQGKDFVELWCLPSGEQISGIDFPTNTLLGVVYSPISSKEFIVQTNSGAQRHFWSSMKATEAAELSLNRQGPLQEVDAAWLRTKYLSNLVFVAEVRFHARDRHLTQFNCWNASTFAATGDSEVGVETSNDFHVMSGMIRSLIAISGSTLFFLDKNFWVCSLDAKQFASTLVARRYFFVLSEWLDLNGDIQCDITAKQDFVFANKHGVTIIKGGLDVSETVLYVPETQTWKVMTGTMHRRGLGSFSGNGSGTSESRPLSIQLRSNRRPSDQGISRMGLRRDSSKSEVTGGIRRGSAQSERDLGSQKGSLQ